MKHISGDKTVKAGIVYRYMWFLIAAVIFAFGQASCSSDNDDPEPEPEPDPTAVAASFTASIKPLGARASSDLWSKGDEIGVFMVSNGSVLSDGSIVGDGINRNLRTSGDRDGKFQPLNNNHRLFFPTDGSKVDFIAYHPYRSDSHVANYKYVINLSDQQADSLFFLYSNNATGCNDKSANVGLEFEHKLVKLVMDITPGGGVIREDLADMRAYVSGMYAKANFNLASGKIEYTGQQPEDFEIFFDAENDRMEMVVFPVTAPLSGRSIIFDIPGVGEKTWDIPAATLFEPGRIYNFDTDIDMAGVTVTLGEVEEWKGASAVAESGEAKPKEPLAPDAFYLDYPNSYMVAPGVELEIPVGKAYAAWSIDPLLVSFGENLAGSQGAELVWQDKVGLITATDITIEGTGKDAVIKVKSSNNADEGNAVIAFTVNGEIYWSWFVWITNYDPNVAAGQKTNNGFTFMDRNLGALTTVQEGRKSGTFYQWGRKDALPGANNYMSGMLRGYDIDGNGTAQGGKTTDAVSEAKDNLKQSIRQPWHFIKSASSWYSSTTENDPYLWSKIDGTKGVYDPCPQGWRVPLWGDNTFSPWYGVTLPPDSDMNGNKGVEFPNLGFYPGSGYIAGSMSMTGVSVNARHANIWTASQSEPGWSYAFRITATAIEPSVVLAGASSMPVRCVKE